MHKTKEEMINPVEVRIPFPGFYESPLNEIIEELERYTLESASGDLTEAQQNELKKLSWRQDFIDNTKAQHLITLEYVDLFIAKLQHLTDVDVRYSFSTMTSPREYNFTTDQVYVFIEYEDLLAVMAKIPEGALDAAARHLFTSRDGFISFYDNTVEAWGQTDTWDHNQWYCVLIAAQDCDTRSDVGPFVWSNLEWYYYDLALIDLSECVDYDKLRQAVREMKGNEGK
jgi:hypothetical protein